MGYHPEAQKNQAETQVHGTNLGLALETLTDDGLADARMMGAYAVMSALSPIEYMSRLGVEVDCSQGKSFEHDVYALDVVVPPQYPCQQAGMYALAAARNEMSRPGAGTWAAGNLHLNTGLYAANMGHHNGKSFAQLVQEYPEYGKEMRKLQSGEIDTIPILPDAEDPARVAWRGLMAIRHIIGMYQYEAKNVQRTVLVMLSTSMWHIINSLMEYDGPEEVVDDGRLLAPMRYYDGRRSAIRGYLVSPHQTPVPLTNGSVLPAQYYEELFSSPRLVAQPNRAR